MCHFNKPVFQLLEYIIGKIYISVMVGDQYDITKLISYAVVHANSYSFFVL